MTWLRLHECKNCWKLPPLRLLPALTDLEISGLDKVVSIGAEFFKGDDCASPVIPFASLEKLQIFNMAAWEKWHSVEVEAFPKLQCVSISGCPKLIGDLPCQLLSLKSLEINGCPLLASCIPKCPEIQSLEVSTSHKVVFQDHDLVPSLRSLSISGDGMLESVFEAMALSKIPNLQELCLKHGSNATSLSVTCLPPLVKVLSIYNCKHVEFPKQQCPMSLERLSIDSSCDTLTSLSMEIFPHINSLYVNRCENLISGLASSIPHQNLQYISIYECKNLEQLCDDSECILPNLKSLEILGCENLISVLDSNTTPLLNLQSIYIGGSKNLKRVCDHSTKCILPNLKSLEINGCPEVEAFLKGFLPSSLTDLTINNCEKLLAHHREWHLPTLTSLTIWDRNGIIKCFSEGRSLPTSLTTLNLFCLSKLEKLNCVGLQHLTSLHELKIYYCPKVEKFTGEMLPTSLRKLIIEECDLLEERCRNKNEEIWPKISHIPAIRLSREWISFDTTFHSHRSV